MKTTTTTTTAKVANVYLDNTIVKTCRVANRGDMAGRCGQKFQGNYLVYVPTIGVCNVMPSETDPHGVDIIGIVKNHASIVADTIAYFKNKKLCIVYDTDNGIEYTVININKKTAEIIVGCLSLNTTGKKCGLCFRAVNGYELELTAYGEKIAFFPYSTIDEIKAEFESEGANIGNFAEYLLSGNVNDIADRFRKKAIDVYFKIPDRKTALRLEVKTSSRYLNVSDSKSNTNFITTI